MATIENRFNALSVKDLLDAREAYHVHLAHKENVFATAIGLYLIRDLDPDAIDPAAIQKIAKSKPRTLRNASPKQWSWPCVLVFVDKWAELDDFRKSPEQAVPPMLYLPDGRVIPTCVVFAEPGTTSHAGTNPPIFPSDLLGGGYPCLSHVQGMDRIASIGCLVTDGDGVYALTNRHVAGPAGRVIKSVVSGLEQTIGDSAGRDVGKKPLEAVYPGWAGSRVMVNLDAGLVRVADVKRWTSQVYAVGEIGPIYDLDTLSFNLDLIGLPVKAHGAASGVLAGQIGALFYRYKSVAGTDYVSDFLIAPRKGEAAVGTRPGDSGTIWFHEPDAPPLGELAPKLRPIAMQWGGQALLSGDGGLGASYALGSCLATICRELEVDVVANWNSGIPETWGEVGHVKVGALACELIDDQFLRDVFMLNQANIGVPDDTLGPTGSVHSADFSPLADVADLVWRTKRFTTDGSNHFADMDQEDSKGKTLLEYTANGDNITPEFWNAFYDDIGAEKRGALPFRVWAMVDEMVGYAAAGDLLRFVCAAGLLGHYVGDACQPLHISKFHHGDGSGGKKGADVHSVYETGMLDANRAALIAKIEDLRATTTAPAAATPGGGREAAKQVVKLMQRTVKALPPIKIVNLFNSLSGPKRIETMWKKLGDRTAACILDGSYTLARIWEAAWKEGRGASGNVAMPAQPFSHKKLSDLYNKKDFTPSWQLENLISVGERLENH